MTQSTNERNLKPCAECGKDLAWSAKQYGKFYCHDCAEKVNPDELKPDEQEHQRAPA